MKLKEILLSGMLIAGSQLMPDISKLPEPVRETNIYCYSEEKPDVILSWYRINKNHLLVAKRIGKERPYAVVIKDGITLLDNGLNNGIAEDGYIDEVRNWKFNEEKSICYDYPQERII